jgi:hypothetical protein
MLNCRTVQTMHDMPSSHVRHLGQLGLLGYWTYNGMPSGHLGYLGHLSCHHQDNDSLDSEQLNC